jgi:hypothetical protein
MIKLTKVSMISGKRNEMFLPLTEEEFRECMSNWRVESGMLIQDAFPTLNADQREFLMTGMTPDEWEHLHTHDE